MLSKKNQKLLKKCVDHWFENLMMLQLNYLSKSNVLTDHILITDIHCSFCQEYSFENACNDCPIPAKVGMYGCKQTPYTKIAEIFISYYVDKRQWYNDLFKAITDEINFLISLGE